MGVPLALSDAFAGLDRWGRTWRIVGAATGTGLLTVVTRLIADEGAGVVETYVVRTALAAVVCVALFPPRDVARSDVPRLLVRSVVVTTYFLFVILGARTGSPVVVQTLVATTPAGAVGLRVRPNTDTPDAAGDGGGRHRARRRAAHRGCLGRQRHRAGSTLREDRRRAGRRGIGGEGMDETPPRRPVAGASTTPPDAADPPPILEIRGVSQRFGSTQALDDVSLVLHAGEIHALLGENGAGKSTLIKIMTGVEHPDAGTLLVDGTEVVLDGALQAQALGIAAIYQEPMSFPTCPSPRTSSSAIAIEASWSIVAGCARTPRRSWPGWACGSTSMSLRAA